MLPELAKMYRDGRIMLLLGAGASLASSDSTGKNLPAGAKLASEIAESAGFNYENEELSVVYSAAKETDHAALNDLLRRRLTQTKPGGDIVDLVKYRWSRVYTINIDDTFETAARKYSKQRIRVFGRDDSLAELDVVFDELQLVKLNGSADRLDDGLIFSPQEYGAGSAKVPAWYRELGQNYSTHVFVVIGSSLNEPLLQHVVAEMRAGSRRNPERGYLISPSATPIQVRHLESLKITHIPGTLRDFVTFLKQSVGESPSGWDLATARRPELKKLVTEIPVRQQRALNSVLIIGRGTLPRGLATGAIRTFYKGYKPTWQDIGDGVPATIEAHNEFAHVLETTDARGRFIGLLGPAGSGKSTTLMCAALMLSERSSNPVYFLRDVSSNMIEVISTLEELNDAPYYVFIDRLDLIGRELLGLFTKKRITRGTLVFAERQNIWRRRLEEFFSPFVATTYRLDRIKHADVDPILSKLQEFGPWTYLEKKRVSERRKELYEKSSRQLLIGLLETTNGLGFTEIIRRDYADVGSQDHQKLLIIVGLATIHRTPIAVDIVGRALEYCEIKGDAVKLISEMEGVIENTHGGLSARHPVYIRELFERVASPSLIRDCLVGLLKAFSDYAPPVIKHVRKDAGFVFKSIINHKFIKGMMRDDEDRVISIYSDFETVFHVDGLYWLQYGLALRDFGRQREALDMFRTALTAYDSPQIEHAYAQQLLIIAEGVNSWEEAEPLLEEAVKILRAQGAENRETDGYPIVALAEGHVKVVRRFRAEQEAREVASMYANEVQKLRKRISSERLDRSATALLSYAATGDWRETEPDIDWEP